MSNPSIKLPNISDLLGTKLKWYKNKLVAFDFDEMAPVGPSSQASMSSQMSTSQMFTSLVSSNPRTNLRFFDKSVNVSMDKERTTGLKLRDFF